MRYRSSLFLAEEKRKRRLCITSSGTVVQLPSPSVHEEGFQRLQVTYSVHEPCSGQDEPRRAAAATGSRAELTSSTAFCTSSESLWGLVPASAVQSAVHRSRSASGSRHRQSLRFFFFCLSRYMRRNPVPSRFAELAVQMEIEV